jgi:hypothetical protein
MWDVTYMYYAQCSENEKQRIRMVSAWQRVLQLASSVIMSCVDLPFYVIKCVEVVSVLLENVI